MKTLISLALPLHWLTFFVFLTALSACGNNESLSGDPNSSETENALALRFGYFDGNHASQIAVDAISPYTGSTMALSRQVSDHSLLADATQDTVRLRTDRDGVLHVSDSLINYTLEYQGIRLVALDSSFFESAGDTSHIVLSESQDSLLLEDFEQPDDFGNLHDLTQASYWWVSIMGGSSVPSTASEFGFSMGPAITSDADELNLQATDQVLHIQTTLEYDPALVLYGLDLLSGIHTEDENSQFMDLRALDSIVLFVQGDGDFTLSLQSKISGDGENQKLLAANVGMDGSWQRVVLVKTDFELRYVASLGVNTPDPAKIYRDISSVVFEFNQSGDWQINNIYLYGRFAWFVGS